MSVVGTFILVLFLDGGAVGTTPNNGFTRQIYQIHGFETIQLCEKAARDLKAKPNTFQCIRAKN